MNSPSRLAALFLLTLFATLVADAAAYDSHLPRLEESLRFGLLVLIGTTVLLLLVSEGRELVRRHRLLWVPFGVSLLASAGIALMGQAGPRGLAEAGPHFSLGVFAAQLNLAFLTLIVAAIWMAAWATLAVIAVARGQSAGTALTTSLSRVPSVFFRTLGTMAIGWIVALAAAGLLLAVFASSSFGYLPLIVIAVVALLWDLITAPALVVVLSSGKPLRAAWGESFRLARSTWHRWFMPFLIQHLALGTVVYLQFSYFGKGSSNRHFTLNVNANWTGAYPTSSNWYQQYTEALDSSPIALVTTLSALPLFGLALALRLRIARTLLSGASL